jgi:hypothetical protein
MTAENLPVILVSGLPRSGSSLMMRMLEAGGVPVLTDGIREPDHDNPNGYYEFERAKRLSDDLSWLYDARGKAVKVLYSPVIYNLPADFRYQVLFMRRKLAEVVASQFAMLHRKGVSGASVDPQRAIALYRIELAKVENWLAGQNNFKTEYVDYNQTLADPRGTCARIKNFLGLDLDEERMSSVISPSLYRHRASSEVDSGDSVLNPDAR